MSDITEGVKAFALAQSQMGAAFKNAKNPFLKNKYADLTAIQNAVYPAFHANGFVITQLPNKDEFGGYVETVFQHISGYCVSGRVYLEHKPNDMQSMGGAITYARRYGLGAISGVPVEDDDGNAATGRGSPSQPPRGVHTPPEKDSAIQMGMRFMRFLEKADAETFTQHMDRGLSLIDDLRIEDLAFARKIEEAFEIKKLELGIS